MPNLSLSVNDIQTIMPTATVANINKYLPYFNSLMPQFGINTNRRIAAFLSQIAVESGNLLFTTELGTGAKYDFRADLGNDQPGDGPKFKGRGLIQITGKINYRAFSKYVYKDERLLVEPSPVASDPQLAVESACWFWGVNNGTVLNAAADQGDFNKVVTTVNGGYNGYIPRVAAYNRANDTLNTGINFVGDQSGSNPASTTASNPAGAKTDFNFQQIQANIDNAEADNVKVGWGSRLTALEESDYIGLKQFLLYLTTRFYSQDLVPFVELVPVYSINVSSKQRTFVDATGVRFIDNLLNRGLDAISTGDSFEKDVTNSNFENSTTLLSTDRFDRTAKKLNDLSDKGGIDLFTIDPFLETSTAFNTPNDIGQQIINDRGFGYKIFGTLTLNPSIQGESLSKAGSIGLKSVEIETGSQVHHGMSLVTVKLLDVQGNKFLDINSPWSFILNSRPGVVGGDFYFRFGWQVRIPNPNEPNDEQAKRFWSHPGWNLFATLSGEGADQGDGGEIVKKYIQNIASMCDGYITLTQSSTLDSMKTPGYLRDTQTGRFFLDRKLDILNYMTLTLINPELSVNPEDGSIEATLFFRSNSAVANCLALLNGSGLPVGKNSAPIFETKQLVNQNNNPSLSQLMKAFVNDNKRYILNSTTLNGVGDGFNKRSVFLTDYDIKDWLTVVGGAGTDSLLDVSPDNINVNVSNDLLKDINEADKKDSRLLIEWLNKVLQENDLTIIAAGDKENSLIMSSQTLNGGFVIAYDSEKQKEQNNRIITGKDLSLKDPTFGDFLNFTNFSESSEDFVGKRLLVQDDVFAFRFQGSLVESINIEKLQQPNEATIQANQAIAGENGENQNKTDVLSGDSNDSGDQVVHQTSAPVTYQTKKRLLNILYSSMLGLSVKCICHPWLKLCRPAYVKGMGFWDGKYMITKLKHTLSEDNKFITEVNACRILNYNNDSQRAANAMNDQETSMNNPNAKKASLILNPIKQNAPKPAVLSTVVYPPSNINFGETPSAPVASPVGVTELKTQIENFLRDLHPSYQSRFREFIKNFQVSNTTYQVYITSGYRSWGEQVVLKQQDARNASPGYSMHNYGLAIDLNLMQSPFRGAQDVVINKSSTNDVWQGTGIVKIALSYGLIWGGTDFGEYRDRVHFGLDKTFDKQVLIALAIKQFSSNPDLIQGNRLKLNGDI